MMFVQYFKFHHYLVRVWPNLLDSFTSCVLGHTKKI